MGSLTQKLMQVLTAMKHFQGFDRILEKVLDFKPFINCKSSTQVYACSLEGELEVWIIIDEIMSIGMTLVSADPGKVICELKLEKEHTNKLGTLHGGLTATLVDDVSTMALLCTERGAPGISVDMNITYMAPAKIGDVVVITAHVLKQGRTLAFTSVDLTNKTTGKLVAQGRHTKHLGS